MPFLKISLSHSKLLEESCQRLKREGSAILAEETGKSIDFVMVALDFGNSFSFGGDSSLPTAYLEVKNVGSLAPSVTAALSGRLCELLEDELSMSAQRIYLEFQESERHLWGWDGKTFA